MSDIRQTAFEVVHRLRRATSHVDIYAELRRTGGVFGYESFIITGLPRSLNENLNDCSILSGWPPEWERRYQEQRHVHVDPVIHHIRGTTDPFMWGEAVEATGARQGMIVMDEARAFGLQAGFCVPFHQLDGSEAGVSFGGDHLSLSQDERAALHLVAIYAMSSAKAVARRRAEPEPDLDAGLPTPLTDRETECLKWASAGKSAWEIGMILAISCRTAEQHLASAARKLGTVSRIQCVAEAIRRGFID